MSEILAFVGILLLLFMSKRVDHTPPGEDYLSASSFCFHLTVQPLTNTDAVLHAAIKRQLNVNTVPIKTG